MSEGLRSVASRPLSRLPRPVMAAVYLVLIVGALVMLFPFFWMVTTSLKDLTEINRIPPTLLPQSWHPENYATAWNKPESTFGRYFLNSAIIAIGGTALQMFCAILAAYAFARMDFPLKGPLFLLFLATLMIPFEVTLIPNFVTIRHLPLLGGNDITGDGGRGLYDSYGGILLPGLANAFSVFLLRQAFLQLPRDFWDAAQIDGASRWLFLWRVAVPLDPADGPHRDALRAAGPLEGGPLAADHHLQRGVAPGAGGDALLPQRGRAELPLPHGRRHPRRAPRRRPLPVRAAPLHRRPGLGGGQGVAGRMQPATAPTNRPAIRRERRRRFGPRFYRPLTRG